MPIRNDPFSITRIRRGLGLTYDAMATALGLTDEDGNSGAQQVEAMERGEQAIDKPTSLLLAYLEDGLPGDEVTHPRFLWGDGLPDFETRIVHTRYPRFFARLVDPGDTLPGQVSVRIDAIESMVVYRWLDDPEAVPEDMMTKIMSAARKFVLDYNAICQGASALEQPVGS